VSELDEVQIIQEIVILAVSLAEKDWRELIINYSVEGAQSDFANSYLIEEGGSIKEKSLSSVYSMDVWLRKLRDYLARGGKQPFTSCKLHLRADGKYNMTYGYDKIDWDALLIGDWNFFPTKKA
jgi:Protein of unknown function, DUF600